MSKSNSTFRSRLVTSFMTRKRYLTAQTKESNIIFIDDSVLMDTSSSSLLSDMSTTSRTNPPYEEQDTIFQYVFPNEQSTHFKKGLQINDIEHPVMLVLVTGHDATIFRPLGGLWK